MKKISVIGTGSIGRRHIGNFLSIGARVTAFDSDPAMRERARGIHPGATYAESLDAALDGADGVAICTPPDSHVALGRRALAAGAHLMIEKPIAHTVDGLEELLKACDAASRSVLTAYNWRYWPPMHKVQELLRQERIGKVLVARTEYSYDVTQRYQGKPARQFYMSNAAQGGGAILDESHAVDYMRWHLGEAAEVFAVIDRISSLDQDSDDVCEVLVKFERGALGNLHMDLFAPVMHGHFEFIGERGMLRWDRPLNQVSVFDSAAQRWEVYPFACQLNDMYVDEARHFLDCIQGKTAPACDGWDGLKTLQLCLAAVRSSAERRWVRP
jgi:predicted dehydrogenase